ncbi:mitochondrial solute carrier protein [Moesziomyces antarcticus T-34]|uniref:Mitochondrial solute carrier protein n=1 Tax=Pseudozyma antarctica (strain T-34) TaxID=1151754 RepID=M9MBG0_PSEA3|nr:mitochondrial solute carrier protein [Moesziomyces antarcticus T-34]
MVAANSASWAGLTRSSQASTSAATLESFLDTAASLASQAAPKLDSPPIARFSPGARTAAASASAVAEVSNPTDVARARAYQQVHSSDSSKTTPSYTSSVSSSSYKDEDEDDGEHHAHTATNHAFLITYFVAGGAAGATSRTVVSPLERLKIIMQVQPQSSKAASAAKGKASSAAKNRAYGGVWTGLVKMWQEEGFAGFMRGNGINCLRIAPYSAVQFTTYELCKTWLRNDDGDLDVVRKLTAGAVAGIASVVSTYPLDLVRSRISIASANMYNEAKSEATSQVSAKVSQEVLREQIAARQKAVPGIWQMTSKVYREEGGLRGLYRGCVPTSIGVAPYVALNFYFYEAARKRITPLDGSEPSALMKLACGALAGSISQTLTYPLDVLRRRMQVAGMKDSQENLGYKDKNAINAIQNILRAEGVTGLYRGLLPNLLKVAPSIGTSFLTYEAVKGFLEVHFDELHPPTPKETSTH